MNHSTEQSKNIELDFSQHKNIIPDNKIQIAHTLWIFDINKIDKLNFTNPKYIAQIFITKQQSQRILSQPALWEKIKKFNEVHQSKIDQWIIDWKIQYVTNKKDYTKKNIFTQKAIERTGLIYKIQLAGCNPNDYIISHKNNITSEADIWKYIKPDLHQEIRFSIAKAVLQHQHIKVISKSQIKKWLIEHFDDIIVPTIQHWKLLTEKWDWDQQQTSRIIRLYDANDEPICRLLIQHWMQKITVKKHQYDDDQIHISCHQNNDSLIQKISEQWKFLLEQINRCSELLYILPYTTVELKESYRNPKLSRKNQIIEISEKFIWKTIADVSVQTWVQKISWNNSQNDWLIIRSIRKRLNEQIQKANAVIAKNNLHISSIKAFED